MLILASVLVNIKSIFTDFDIDAEYALVMAYRMASGDKMITQMWEPHQTSAFLAAMLIHLFQMIFETTTGIVIYLHICGVVIKGFCVCGLYRTMVKFIEKKIVLIMCIFLFIVSPKGMLMPEFSNMQLWFSIGLLCSLLLYLENQKNTLYLLMASIFLCLQIISYPSCIISFIMVIFLLVVYADKKRKACVIFSASCILMGILYVAVLFWDIGITQFFENVKYIIYGDASHAESFYEKGVRYLQQSIDIAVVLGMVSIIAFFITGMWYIIKKSRTGVRGGRYNYIRICDRCFCVLLLIYVLYNTFVFNNRFQYLILYIVFIIKALVRVKKCKDIEKKIFVIGVVLGVSSLLAVLVFSNMPLTASFGYLIPAIVVSFIPMLGNEERADDEIRFKEQWSLSIAILLIFMLRHGLVILTPSDTELIWDVGGIVRSGPAKGIVAEYMRAYIINESLEEWNNYIKQGNSIMIVGADRVSTLGYMYGDTIIGVDSTICTPSYNEKLLEYWKLNPEKYPDVVVVECWYGELKVDKDTWIMKWVEEFSSDSYYDGKYWRYYY